VVDNVNFHVGDLVRWTVREGIPLGIVTRGDYIGNWIETAYDGGGVHVDVLVEGEEYHCLPQWLEKVQ